MDPAHNPFSPGAGTPPPELAGRSAILGDAELALKRIKARRWAKSQLLLGLRGVGKTVLLNEIARRASAAGYLTLLLEAPEDRTLAELLVPPLRRELFRLDRVAAASHAARRAMGALRAFASAFKVKAGDVEFGVEASAGTADSGDLEFDLPDLLALVATAASAADRPLAIVLDEMQYLGERDLRALIVAMHRTAQMQQPVVLFGAGLPQLAALAGDAKSYAERLFDFPDVGPLGADAAREAIERPLAAEGVRINRDALASIVATTQGYPYFLQEWGAKAWNAASRSPVTLADANSATTVAVGHLDQGFFRVRLDRLSPREREYLRAMASLGAGPHRSGAIADALGVPIGSASPLRDALISKGMIYSFQHGELAFTVPLFDEYMRRAMPKWTAPRAAGQKVARTAAAKARKGRGKRS